MSRSLKKKTPKSTEALLRKFDFQGTRICLVTFYGSNNSFPSFILESTRIKMLENTIMEFTHYSNKPYRYSTCNNSSYPSMLSFFYSLCFRISEPYLILFKFYFLLSFAKSAVSYL